MGVSKLPPVLGLTFYGMPLLLINDCRLLTDLYVNKNQYQTKHIKNSGVWELLMLKSLLFDQSQDKKYQAKRKELSGAFFKSKLIPMTKIIKRVTL